MEPRTTSWSSLLLYQFTDNRVDVKLAGNNFIAGNADIGSQQQTCWRAALACS